MVRLPIPGAEEAALLTGNRAALIAALRQRLARQEGPAPSGIVPVAAEVDVALPGGGLARGAVHEILVAETGASEALSGYLLGRTGGTAAWIAPPRAPTIPWPQGLAALGLAPSNLILLDAAEGDALWAAEQALRCRGLSAVAAILPRLDLAAARRLQLAAEAGGTLGLLLRPDTPDRVPTVARTRWRASSLPGASAAHRLGAPCWRLELLFARGGRQAAWDVTFDVSNKLLIVNDPLRRAARG